MSFCQGIDLVAGGRNTGHKRRDAPKSKNPYLALLVQVCFRSHSFAALFIESATEYVLSLEQLFVHAIAVPLPGPTYWVEV